jgi:hypothetical protein
VTSPRRKPQRSGDLAIGSSSALLRLAFRLLVAIGLAALWPGPSPQRAAGAFCVFLAAGCVTAALRFKERPWGDGINRWHEGGFLLALGVVLIVLGGGFSPH